MLRSMAKEGLEPATQQRARDILRNALNQAVRWNLVPRNVVLLVDPPKVERYEARVLSFEEAQQLMDEQQGIGWKHWSGGLVAGLTRGRGLGLRWEDVDLDAASLSVRVALQRVNGKLTLVKPKTKQSQTHLTASAVTCYRITCPRSRQLHEQLLAGSRWQEHGLVFCTVSARHGVPAHGTRLQTLLTRAKLPPMRFHDLRHSCATLLLAQRLTRER
jgi:integrase